MSRKGIIFTGSGGQGVITASIILAEAAVMYDDLNAVQAQSYGPEARGGATRADVVLSDEPIFYPKVIKPHVLICLTQMGYDKYSSLVRPGGLVVTDSFLVREKQGLDAKMVDLNMYKAVQERIGQPIAFNMCVLGSLIGLTGVVRLESIIQILETKLPAEFVDLNSRALKLGFELARESAVA